jgi:uncharacterized protein (DUF1697 family)
MPAYAALLRAVNVGGTGKLPMTELRAMCEAIGFANVRTYIASGNVVFTAAESEAAVKAALERALEAYAGKPVAVMVRTGAEMASVIAANPFPAAAGNRTMAIFLDEPPPMDAPAGVTGRQDEEVALGTREIYSHYPSGMGRSKLKIPAPRNGTARNMNTIATLAEWAAALPD